MKSYWLNDAHQRAQNKLEFDTHIHIHFNDGTKREFCKSRLDVLAAELNHPSPLVTVPAIRTPSGIMRLTDDTCEVCVDVTLERSIKDWMRVNAKRIRWRDAQTGELLTIAENTE